MSLQVTSSTDTAYHPIFLTILEDLPGGAILLTDRIPLATTEIKKGALLHRVVTTLGSTLASAGQYRLVKTAKLATSGSRISLVTITVYTNHEFKVGECMGEEGGATGSTIATITKGATTDRILFVAGSKGLWCDEVSTGTVLEEKTSSVLTSELYAANSILRNDTQVRKADLTTLQNVGIGIVERATVNESLMPYFVSATDKAVLIATNMMRFV